MKANFDSNDVETVRLTLMEQGFKFCSFREKSIPSTKYDPTDRLEILVLDPLAIINKTINHRDGSITVATDIGYVRFIK